jgi:hypothetical protein
LKLLAIAVCFFAFHPSLAEAEVGRLEYGTGRVILDDRFSKVEGLLASAALDFETAFNIQGATPLKILIVSQEEWGALSGAPIWATGIFHRGSIFIPNTDFALEPDTLRKTIRHEYVHAVIARLSGNRCPAWFDEGLAQLFEGKRLTQEDYQELTAFAKTSSSIKLKHFGDGFTSLTRRKALDAYRFSLYATLHLLNEASPRQIVEFLTLLSKRISIEGAFKQAFGRPYSGFESSLLTKLGHG